MDLLRNDPCCDTKQVECYSDTLLSDLRRRQQRSQLELSAITSAIEALEKNPETANILELIRKVGR